MCIFERTIEPRKAVDDLEMSGKLAMLGIPDEAMAVNLSDIILRRLAYNVESDRGAAPRREVER